MKKCLSLTGCFFFCLSFIWAQQTPTANDPASNQPVVEPPAAKIEKAELASIEWPMDSMIPAYRFPPMDPSKYDTLKLNIYNFPSDSVPTYPAEVIAQRLLDIGSEIPLAYNEYVQAYINLYTKKRRGQVHRMLGLQHVYFPIFEAELDRQGLPMELKYLPVVESALNPHAVSRAGATGLWQFMLATGKLFDLKVTSYVDERRDPYKATRAAVSYLKRMYKSYGDWLLVIAAYNCGPGNVNKALRRAKGKTDFWEIREFLPRETRGYVPAFISAVYTFHYPAEHNIYPKYINFSFFQDTLQFKREKLTLQQLAALSGTDMFELLDLNPELKSLTIPYTPKPYTLRVPQKTAEIFATHGDSLRTLIAALQPDTSKTDYVQKLISPLNNKTYKSRLETSGGVPTAIGNKVLVYHRVRSGEVVGKIAARYHVYTKDIKRWNNLKGYRIRVGQKLKIYCNPKYARGSYSKSSSSKSSAKTTPKPKTSPKIVAVPGGPAKYHKVRSGDNLWDIANKYEGVSVEQIKKLNNMSNNSLKPGQVLRIK